MIFADLKASLKGTLAPAYIASGSDVFLINKSVELILNAAQIAPLNVIRLDEDASLDTINANLQNVSMFGGATAVVVRGTDAHVYLKPIKDLKAATKIDCNPMSEPLVVRLIMQNPKYPEITAIALARACENNFSQISNEMQKLDAYYIDKSTLELADLADIITTTVKYQVFELSNALLKRDAERARNIFEYLEMGGTDDYSVFAMLMSFARRLFFARASLLHDADLAKYLGVHPYSVTILRRDKNINTARAARIFESAIDLEYQIKSGKILPARASLILAGQITE